MMTGDMKINILTMIVLIIPFIIALMLLFLLPKLFVATIGMYCIYVSYVVYDNAKKKKEMTSGMYDTALFYEDENRHIK